MTLQAFQVHIDGLPGPSFNYGGLSYGNVASLQHSMEKSNPRKAALQILYKMKHLADMGIKQIVMPPQERPSIGVLRQLGFMGTDIQVLESAYRSAPDLVTAVSSSSSTWAANSATITPSTDSADRRVHITPANSAHFFHRSLEVETNQMLFYALFPHPEAFVQHDPLPGHAQVGDEGSANQLRLCRTYEEAGIHVMVYGKRSFGTVDLPRPQIFPARQALEASEAISRLHRLSEDRVLYVQQHPDAIDAGVFHNDLAALCNQNVLIYHERAWLHSDQAVETLSQSMTLQCRCELQAIRISEQELPLRDLIVSGLLNSQLVTVAPDEMVLLAPVEVRDHPRSKAVIDRLLDEVNPIERVYYFDLSESMRAGGGPRSLSLPAILTASEWEAVYPELILTEGLYQTLIEWVNGNYREELLPGDVADPELLYETRRALDDLTEILDLGPLYPFQQE